MNEYDSHAMYLGNIYEYREGRLELVGEDVYILYNNEIDTFFPLEFYCYLMDLKLNKDKLSERELLEYEKIFLEHNYPYHPQNIEGQKYIDKNSIKIIIQSKNEKKASKNKG